MTSAAITTTKTFTGQRHTGYTVTNDAGTVLATVTEGRKGGFFVRCFSGPDSPAAIYRVTSLLDARDIAERHAARF